MKNKIIYLIALLITILSLESCYMIMVTPKRHNKLKVYNENLVREGVWVEADSTLTVHFINYSRGQKNGRFHSLDTSGNLFIGNYKKGVKNGWFRAYDSDGNIMYEFFYKDDTIIQQGIYSGPTF